MSSVKVLSCSFSKPGDVIEGDLNVEITFSDSEINNNVGFIVGVVLGPSRESTDSVIYSQDVRTGTTTYVTSRRKEVYRELSGVAYPNGNRTVTFGGHVSFSAEELFMPGGYSAWSKATNRGVDVVRVDARPEICASSAGGPAGQRFT